MKIVEKRRKLYVAMLQKIWYFEVVKTTRIRHFFKGEPEEKTSSAE